MHFQFSDSEMDENNDSIQQSEQSELSDDQLSPSDSEPTESELSQSESEMTEAISGSPMTSQSEMSHRLDSQMTEDKVTAESDYSSDRIDSRSRSRSNTASMSDKYRSLSQSQISENESGTDFTPT